jgi:predicted HicB family RNase H-like nuclease
MNRKKDTKMTLRLCQEDKSFLTKEAMKNKMSLSHYVRNVVANSYPNIEG